MTGCYSGRDTERLGARSVIGRSICSVPVLALGCCGAVVCHSGCFWSKRMAVLGQRAWEVVRMIH